MRSPDNVNNLKITYWQHQGLGFGMSNKSDTYQSKRINRDQDSSLFLQKPNINDFIIENIGMGIYCQIPISLYCDDNHTYPITNKDKLGKLINKLEEIKKADTEQLLYDFGKYTNLAIQLLIDTDKESFVAIKNSQKQRSLSDRKKAKLFAKKVKLLKPVRDTLNYPNRTPLQVLEAMEKMKKNTDAVAQVFFYLSKVNEDRFEFYVDFLAKNELKLIIPYRTLEKAKQKILNTPEYLNATESFTIEVEYMTGLTPLTFTKTNNGWVFDERYD